jgi:hypothetical protein
MGARTIDMSRKRDSLPGPGQYETLLFDKTVVKDPSFSIGRSKRLDQVGSKKLLPGPSDYDSYLNK